MKGRDFLGREQSAVFAELLWHPAADYNAMSTNSGFRSRTPRLQNTELLCIEITVCIEENHMQK